MRASFLWNVVVCSKVCEAKRCLPLLSSSCRQQPLALFTSTEENKEHFLVACSKEFGVKRLLPLLMLGKLTYI